VERRIYPAGGNPRVGLPDESGVPMAVSSLISLKKSLGTGGADGSIDSMTTRCATHRIRGFTRVELLVIIGVLALLAAMVFPALNAAKAIKQRINCVNNLKQIGLAFRVWEGDNYDKYPMEVYATNQAMMKLVGSGNAHLLWRTISCLQSTNEYYLRTPEYLYCPADTTRKAATNFKELSDANISYFLSLDAVERYPQMILDGDDNLAVDGVRVKPGFLSLGTKNTIVWTKERHYKAGNIGMADGSVQQATIESLNSAVAFSTSIAITNSTPSAWVFP
jgi:prepilin-type processing-associated H-X9-DG protein